MLIEESNDGDSRWHFLGVLAVVALLLVTGVVQTMGLPNLGEAETIQVAQESPPGGADRG